MSKQADIHKLSTDKRKTNVWLFIALSILIACIAFVAFINYAWKPFLSKKVKSTVYESTKGLYVINFSDVRFNIISGQASFDNLNLKADTLVYERLKRTKDAPRHLYSIKLDKIIFTDISLSEIYFKKKLHLVDVMVNKPEVTIIYNDIKTKADTADKKTAYQQLSKFLKSFSINRIILKDADITYRDQSASKPKITNFKGFMLKVSDFKIDSLSQFDKSRFYYTKDISLLLKNHRFTTKDGLYNISIGEVLASTRAKSFKLTKLRVKPLYPEIEFSHKYKMQHDRYDFTFKEIGLSNIDFNKLNTERRLIADKLQINGADLKIFMNRAMPPVDFDKGRNYPHVVLKRLKISTRIDTLLIKNSNINYSEYNPKSKNKGTVTFNNFNARILNITNDSLSLVRSHWARASTSALLMGKAALNVSINFNLTSANADFNFNGTVGKMDMRILNTLTRNMSLAEITSGTINKADFKVSGNLRTTTGYIKLYYNDLKLILLKTDDETNDLKTKTIVSALANTIIKNENPGKDGLLRIGKTEAERANYASFFNLMWKSIFAGIKESVGVTIKNVEKIQVKPSNRELRKAERKSRREVRKKAKEEQKE